MSVIERKERLSEIVRARLTDFIEFQADAFQVNPETWNSARVQKIYSRTKYNKNGKGSRVHTSEKIYDRVSAIAELNKVDGYAVGKPKGDVPLFSPVVQVVNAEITESGKPY
jgi:hypothetical protein